MEEWNGIKSESDIFRIKFHSDNTGFYYAKGYSKGNGMACNYPSYYIIYKINRTEYFENGFPEPDKSDVVISVDVLSNKGDEFFYSLMKGDGKMNYLNKMLEKLKKVPAYESVFPIVTNEIIYMGNTLLAIDQISTHPSETYYIVLFKNHVKGKYENIKTLKAKGYYYDSIFFSDNNGAVEIRFYCE